MANKFFYRGWKFPVEYDPGKQDFAASEYEESIKQAIWIILSTAKGERVMRPSFGCGIHELVFAINNATTIGEAKFEVAESLRIWEPRIQVLDIEATASGINGEKLLINVTYRVIATDNQFNLVYPLYLQ